jgi:phosphoglycolate phosphatase
MTKKFNPSLIIFDWSGVISDDRKPVYTANNELLKHYGKPTFTFEEWLPRTTLGVEEFLQNYGVCDQPEKMFDLYKSYLSEAINSGIVPFVYADAHDTISYLKNQDKNLLVLSSHPTENLAKEAEEYNLLNFFEEIVGSVKDKTEKLLEICKNKKVEPSSVLYIGDTIYDIQAAKGARVISAGICNGYHVRERLEREKPDILINTLQDLKAFI